MRQLFFLKILFVCFAFLLSCTKDKLPLPPSTYNGYPEEVGKIFLTSCATSGCHNDKSYEAAAGLNLSSWDKLFQGAKSGSVVIPYSAEQSPLMFFINTYSELGQQLQPVMPVNDSPLSREQVMAIKNWIESGSPDASGFVKFSDNPNRKKIYVANQGCDLVTVFDAETKLAMRCIKTGISDAPESPHMLKVSPDGKYWYVCFLNSTVLQKFRTYDDSHAADIYIGAGNWNTFALTSDSKKAFVVDWASSGKIAVVDLEKDSMIELYQGSAVFEHIHGSTINQSGKTLYVTAQTGNFIYKIDVSSIKNPEPEKIPLQPGELPSLQSKYDAHEILLSPDETKYFVTCQKTNELRILQTSNDNLLAAIPVGIFPQEMAISKTTDYLFVTSPEDTASFPGRRGSVSIINYKTNTFVKNISTGFQPHGIAVDDEKMLVYVANRNANPAGTAPHHTSLCGGRNGYITIIDMNTLDLVPSFKAEVSVDPYSIAIRK